MSEGTILTLKNVINCVTSNWTLQDLKIKNDDRSSVRVI